MRGMARALQIIVGMTTPKRALTLSLTTAALIAMAGCPEKDSPAEKAGEKIEDAADKAGDGVEKAGEKIEDAVE